MEKTGPHNYYTCGTLIIGTRHLGKKIPNTNNFETSHNLFELDPDINTECHKADTQKADFQMTNVHSPKCQMPQG